MTRRRQRPADRSFVREICHVTYEGDAHDVSTPDGGWDLVFMQRSGVMQVLQTGVITRPVDLGYAPGDEYLAITAARRPLRGLGSAGSVRTGRADVRGAVAVALVR